MHKSKIFLAMVDADLSIKELDLNCVSLDRDQALIELARRIQSKKYHSRYDLILIHHISCIIDGENVFVNTDFDLSKDINDAFISIPSETVEEIDIEKFKQSEYWLAVLLWRIYHIFMLYYLW